MRTNRRHLVAVALLAVLTVVFGLTGTVAPELESASPPEESSSSSSDSVGHFMNPPTYDSDWVNITDKCGQYFNITHSLDTREVFVDIMGKQAPDGGEHQRNLGGTSLIPGWSRTYGGESADRAYSVIQTIDGGYAIAGYSTIPPGTDFSLVKTDALGNMLWNRTYGAGVAYSVIQTSEEGYALAGSGFAHLVKTDAAGNMVWNKKYSWLPEGRSVVQTLDGGYAVAGGLFAFCLVKTDQYGDMEWNKTYENVPGAYYDQANSVVQTFDEGYALAGLTGDGSNIDFYLVKTDSAGNMEWNKTYGGRNPYPITGPHEAAYSMVQTFDEGYALAGWTDPQNYEDFWLVKTDSAGNMEWNRTYGGDAGDVAYSLVQTVDGGYALAGYTTSPPDWHRDFLLIKTDSDGNTQWNKTYGRPLVWIADGLYEPNDEAWSVVPTSDGGYAIAGFTDLPTHEWWLVKTDIELGLVWTHLANNTITLYRGLTDLDWNYVRVSMWIIKEPSWIYGDINMDGVVDVKDLYILSRNYGKTFSLLSLSGIIAIAGIHTVKKRKQPKQPS